MSSLETLVVPIVAGSGIGGNIFALSIALLTAPNYILVKRGEACYSRTYDLIDPSVFCEVELWHGAGG